MKKVIRPVLTLVLIFVFAVAVGRLWAGKDHNVPAEQIPQRLVNCNADAIHDIEIDRSKPDGKIEKIVLQRADEAGKAAFSSRIMDLIRWDLVEPKQIEADNTLITRIATLACETYDPRQLKAADVSPKEVLRLNLREAGAKDRSWTLVFRPQVSGGKYAVTVLGAKGGEKSYAVQPGFERLLTVPVAAMINRRVARTTPGNVMAVQVLDRGKELFSLQRSGGGWVVKRGKKVLGNASVEATKYVNRTMNLLGLKAEDGAGNCEQRARYRVKINGVAGRREELFFSGIGTKSILGCSSQRQERFKIHPDFAKYFVLNPHKLM